MRKVRLIGVVGLILLIGFVLGAAIVKSAEGDETAANWSRNLTGIGTDERIVRFASIGNLTVSLAGMTNATVNRDSSFTFSSNVSCAGGDCGNISAYIDSYSLFESDEKPFNNIIEIREVNNAARIIVVALLIVVFIAVLLIAPSNKRMVFGLFFTVLLFASVSLTFQLTGYVSYEVVFGTIGSTPFYTSSANPASCGILTSGESCSNSWAVVATGNAAAYEFFVKYNSTAAGVEEQNTSSVFITINIPASNTSSGRRISALAVYEISDDNFKKGYRQKVYLSDVLRFNFMEGVHTLKIIGIKSGEIRFVVASEPITVDIKAGEVKEVDIDGDGESDMNVELISAGAGVAEIVLKSIVIEQPLIPANGTIGNESAKAPEVSWYKKMNFIGVIASLAVIILFLVLSRALVNRIKSSRLKK